MILTIIPLSLMTLVEFKVMGLVCRECTYKDIYRYGDNLQRRFTGLISDVSTSSDGYVANNQLCRYDETA